jgi:hypothetical protein
MQATAVLPVEGNMGEVTWRGTALGQQMDKVACGTCRAVCAWYGRGGGQGGAKHLRMWWLQSGMSMERQFASLSSTPILKALCTFAVLADAA